MIEQNAWTFVPLDHAATDPQHWLIMCQSPQDGWVCLAEVFGREAARRLCDTHNRTMKLNGE